MCDCRSETETADHFFLRCQFLQEKTLLNSLFKMTQLKWRNVFKHSVIWLREI